MKEVVKLCAISCYLYNRFYKYYPVFHVLTLFEAFGWIMMTTANQIEQNDQ